MSNLSIFEKLENAQKIFLNPTLDLISNNKPLEKHCYYKLNKYPSGNFDIWDNIDKALASNNLADTSLDALLGDDNINLSKYSEVVKLKSNLGLAIQNNDINYLMFLKSHQPKKKMMLKLKRKDTVINKDLAEKLLIDQETLNHLTSSKLKMMMHKYIKVKDLQEDSEVRIDSALVELLNLDSNKESKQMHYLDLLKVYKAKYVTS
tara:strand:+ start:883 stop:1500 length:618 start_codon:yes stop_codon:yes gene_type:complete